MTTNRMEGLPRNHGRFLGLSSSVGSVWRVGTNRRNAVVRNCWLTALVAGICAWPRAGATALPMESLALQVDRIRVDNNAPSLAVAVARRGKIVWERGFGWADRENRVPATEHTMYSLASVSKPMTATGLMVLVQTGRIQLDRPINEYLGDAKLKAWVGDAHDATVRRVANHTSGLPLHAQFFFADQPYRPPSMDETILHYGNLVTAPGERYQYSNLGYGVIDYVISRVSGQSFSEFMRQAVFMKLGLTHTSVGPGPGLTSYQAIRYDASGAPIPFYDFDHVGASGVYSSAHDLVSFGMFHLKDHLSDQQAILSDASLDEMHRPTARVESDPTAGYGIGWEVYDRRDGYRVVSHSGSMPGVQAFLTLIPAEDLAVVILTNGGDAARPVRDLVMKTLVPNWSTPPPAHRDPEPFRPVAQLTGTWLGQVHTYSGDRSLELDCLPDGNIHMKIADEPATLLTNIRSEKGQLTAETLGQLNTPDLDRHQPYKLVLDMRLRGQVLSGSITAIPDSPHPFEGPRPFALTHWAQLQKKP